VLWALLVFLNYYTFCTITVICLKSCFVAVFKFVASCFFRVFSYARVPPFVVGLMVSGSFFFVKKKKTTCLKPKRRVGPGATFFVRSVGFRLVLVLLVRVLFFCKFY